MASQPLFPSLTGFEPTRETLKLYARAVAAIPRAYAPPHPRWWHASLKVVADGLVTDHIALPAGGDIHLKLDLVQHEIVLCQNDAPVRAWDMAAGETSTRLGESIIAAVEGLGLAGGDYGRDKFASDDARVYEPATVAPFLTALTNADRIFKAHRATLGGEPGPVQFWPHGFDLAFEWFGSRIVSYEEHGQVQEYPAQLNLGFYPAAPAYFYSTPWPFDADALLGETIVPGASWHTEGWQGSELPYVELADTADAESRLLAYARRVFELAAPTLSAVSS